MSTTKDPATGLDGGAIDWPTVYDAHDGRVGRVAEVTGLPERVVRGEFDAHGLDPRAPVDREELLDMSPEEVGLPPLGCGECGAADIGEHPCPECGFDPATEVEVDREQATLAEIGGAGDA